MARTLQKNRNIDMINGSVLWPLICYSVPIVLTQVLQLLFNAADIVVVGQFVGDSAVAAVGSCAPLINLLINLFVGISLGATVVLASTLGAKQEDRIHDLTHTIFSLGVVFGFFTGIIGVVFARTFLEWMGTTPESIDQATTYLRIYFIGAPAFMIYTFGRAIIVATGDTKRPLIYLSSSGVINVILNLILVAGCGMGVAGVAIATVTSQVISAVLMTSALLRLDSECRIFLFELRLHGKPLKRILKLGLPVGFQNTLFSFSNVIIQSSVNSLGTFCAAGNSACMNIDSFIYAGMNSFTQGCMTFAGQNYGAKRYDRLNEIYRSALLCITAIGLTLGGIAYIFGGPLLRLYLPDSPQSVTYGMARMLVLVIPDFLCGLMDCGSGMLRGIKRSVYPMIATIIGSCGLRLLWVFTVFAHFKQHTHGVAAYRILLLSYPLSWALTFFALLFYYIRVKRLYLSKV
ncbi:MAG: MATE family efflux transporter [Clostridiales bacterium]|nr:MATE family efflux transporter [Clostridiales bacterium]MBR5973637.1 MATE family efflux transporter [Clostridiales bacterium]